MAQNWVPKQTAFTQKYVGLVQDFMNSVDAISLANAEFATDAYGTGGANAITDAIVQGVIPAGNAALFNEMEGAMVSILQAVASNRGYLEIARP